VQIFAISDKQILPPAFQTLLERHILIFFFFTPYFSECLKPRTSTFYSYKHDRFPYITSYMPLINTSIKPVHSSIKEYFD